MTNQEQIREEYQEISAHRHTLPDEREALEGRRKALRTRCTHPNLGEGMLPGGYNQPVAPNQCPDCGFIAESEPTPAGK
jgi:hypothetical protein